MKYYTSRYYYIKIFFLSLMIMSVSIKYAHASQIDDINVHSFKQYNHGNTCVQNEFNITGKLLNVRVFKNSYRIKTSDGAFILENNSVEKDETDKDKILPSERIEDLNGDMWFSTTQHNYYSETGLEEGIRHKLFKIDSDGRKICYAVIKNPPRIFYKDVFSKLKVDKKNNIWFIINKQDCIEKENEYKLGKVTQTGNISYYEFSNEITDYIITSDNIWVLLNDGTVDVINYKGKLIEEYNFRGISDITKDSGENIWILQNGAIKKYCDGKFELKYNVDKSYNRLNVYDDNRIAAFGYRKVTLIEKSKHKDIIIDSYVNDSTFVIRNNDGKVVILNAERDDWNISYEYRDDTLGITTFNDVDNDAENFKINRIKGGKNVPFYYSSVCGDKIFVPCLNSIYLLENNELIKYAVFSSLSSSEGKGENIKYITADSDNNLYAITNNKLYIIDRNRKIKEFNIWALTKESNINDDRIFVKLLRDRQGKIYVDSALENKHIIYSIEGGILKEIPNQVLQIKEKIYYPINVFINNNNEIDMVYDFDGKYVVYDYEKHRIDSVFNNQNKEVNKLLPTIKQMVKAYDDTIFVIMDENVLYAKMPYNDRLKKITNQINNASITSIASDKKGNVYIGTYDNGIYVYN